MKPVVRLFRHTSLLLDREVNYLLAGDGLYHFAGPGGLHIPVLLLPCEIRGLPPLQPWLDGDFACDIPFTASDVSPAAPAPSYHVLTPEQAVLPPLNRQRVYQYVIAREGIFLQAACTGLEVLMPITERANIVDLASATPLLRPAYPRVDAARVQQLLASARSAVDSEGQPVERLFYLLWEGTWKLYEPEQEASQVQVRATALTTQHLSAFIEGHSHHHFAARFSAQDDQAEVNEFRVYFVLGRIFERPELRVRICVHGYVWEVPATCFFELPTGIVDCVAREWREAGDAAGY